MPRKRKAPALKPASAVVAQTPLLNAQHPRTENGLGAALGLNAFGLPTANWPNPYSEPLSSGTPLFKNMRWYLITNFWQVLSELYVEIGLIRTIVDVPVDDALRGGVKITSSQLSPDDIKQLQVHIDRRNDMNTLGMAAKWTRLFGGGGLVVVTDQDPETPLNLEDITEEDELEFRAADLWELFYGMQNTGDWDGDEYLPGDGSNPEFYTYYNETVHHTRVLAMKGLIAPSFIRPRLRGWGLSVCEILVRSVNQYLKATNLSYEVLDEFKLDVFKIKNLVNTLLMPNGQDLVRQRVQMANMQKNFQHALVIDGEDDYDHKQLSFTGLADAMAGIRMQVASDLRMPLTKLFGISAAGFNSGEDDIEVYNAMVESEIREKIKHPALRLVELRCQEIFGYIPDDISIEFKPLRVLSAEQQENVKTQVFNRVIMARQSGLLTDEQFCDACNVDKLLPIQLEPDLLEDLESDPGEDIDAEDEDTRSEENAEEKTAVKARKSDAQRKGQKTPKEAPIPNVATYTRFERVVRAVSNSARFDKASYEADGGDKWIDPRRKELFRNPGGVDEALWRKAKEASQAALGEVRWQFVTWWYKKQGGKFH